jgi:hypothetical protein
MAGKKVRAGSADILVVPMATASLTSRTRSRRSRTGVRDLLFGLFPLLTLGSQQSQAINDLQRPELQFTLSFEGFPAAAG